MADGTVEQCSHRAIKCSGQMENTWQHQSGGWNGRVVFIEHILNALDKWRTRGSIGVADGKAVQYS